MKKNKRKIKRSISDSEHSYELFKEWSLRALFKQTTVPEETMRFAYKIFSAGRQSAIIEMQDE